MLQNLHIKNIALIDELDISFDEGLNVLTGETGAGKSVIIGSIGIGLGGKFDKELLRDSEKDGMVELTFSVDNERIKNRLKEVDIDITEDVIIISRRIKGGRTISRINDMTCTASKLKEVAEIIINLHAQHEQQTLLDQAKHLRIIDDSDDRIRAAKEKVSEAYRAYREVHDRIVDMEVRAQDRTRELDYLEYEINEIEAAKLIPGEDSELEEDFRKMQCSADIRDITGEVYMITGYDRGDSAGSSLSRACAKLKELEKYDGGEKASELFEGLTEIDSLLSDFNHDLTEYIQANEFEPAVLEETEKRLNLINSLKLKYGKTIEDITDNLEGFRKSRDELQNYDATLLKLKTEEEELKEKLETASEELSILRKEAADALSQNIEEALKKLNFSEVHFRTEMEKLSELGPSGRDKAVFMISTNVGEPEKPLNMVASGGELSRVMLAVKSCLSDAEDTPTLVFDEIDVGISGITAGKVAEMMKELSRSRQIITITHLPQIASAADHSFVIEKNIENGKTHTSIRPIYGEERVQEIARILGGDKITDAVLESAREMLCFSDPKDVIIK